MQGKSKLLGRALAALALIGASLATQAVQAGTMHWLRLEQNPEVAAFYADVARRFEAANPGIRVELQFLENESYKQKLTTLLQSPDKPHVIYSWADGVLREQIKAGVIEDISDAVNAGGWKDRFSPSALNLYAVDGRTYGLPMLTSRYRGVVLPQVALNRDALCPWPLGIMAFQGEFSTDWHLVLAFITLTIAPMVLLFFAAQRHIVAGLTAGAVKG